MSQWRGRLEENPELESAVDWLTGNYQIPVVALLLAFMLWNRLRSVSNFVVDGEVLFRGNDAWYHYRTVTYTVQNWPATMPFDAWTYFPYGNASGQFGTLFDQIIATAALIVGLGSPSEQTIAMTLLVAPAFFAAAAGIPAYFIGRRLGGRLGGITALTVLAFSVGSFFTRSLVGFSDHQVAEALFQTLGILGVMVAVTIAHREKPIYEQLVDRDFETLRPTLAWSALAGLGMALYLWVWPFGVLLIGIVGVFLLFQMCLEVLRGESPEHTAIAGAILMGVTGILALGTLDTATITATEHSLLQPFLAFSVAGGCVFMAWLAREWEDRDIDKTLYPLAIGAILVALIVVSRLVVPGLLDYFVNQFLRIFGLGFTTSQTGGTVGEVQPLVNWQRQGLGAGIQQLFGAYGFALFLGFLGGGVILARQFWDDKVPAEQLLIVVWLVFTTATTFTQARFQYYLVFPVAALTGYAVSIVVEWIDLDSDVSEVETYQVLTIVTILLVILVPIAPAAIGAGSADNAFNRPDGDIRAWSNGLGWMSENTPEEGTFNNSGEEMELYGTNPRVDDYDYEAGAYGVLSWWDYGHWITAQGERIPTANPFQQGSTTAANFLLSPNESQAGNVIEDVSEDDAKTRYVIVDYKMVDTYKNFRGKFFAPTNFYDEGDVAESDYTQRIFYDLQRSAYFRLQSQQFYNTTAVRLYQNHGSAVEPEPYVIDWGRQEAKGGVSVPAVPPQEPNSQNLTRYDSMEGARNAVQNDTTASIGGIGGKPSERVEAMEHYRLVGASEQSATSSNNYNRGLLSTALALFGDRATAVVQDRSSCTSDVTVPVNTNQGRAYYCLSEGATDFLQPTEPRWTKIFERVPGATIEGTGPENTTVRGQVEMQMPGSNETFAYHQLAETGEDGTFTMTVPYSTTGYEEWGTDEGQTNVSVRANSSYQFQATQADNGTVYAWSDTADVSEGQVIGKDDSAPTADMERSVLFEPDQQGNGTNESEGSTSGNETDGATDG